MYKILKYLKNEKLNEILGVLLFSLGILILISVLTFDLNDPPASNRKIVSNCFGPIGSYLSYYLFLFIGKGVYIFPFLIILLGFYEFKDKIINEQTVLKVAGIAFLTIGMSIFFNILGEINIYTYSEYNAPNVIQKGGIIGFYFTAILFPSIKYGIYLVVFLLLTLGLVLSTSISFSDFLKRIFNYKIKFAVLLLLYLRKTLRVIGTACKEIFYYIKEKGFKDAIQILDEEDLDKLARHRIESDGVVPKITRGDEEEAVLQNSHEPAVSEKKVDKKVPQEAEPEEEGKKGFLFFNRKKKKEVVSEPVINKNVESPVNKKESDEKNVQAFSDSEESKVSGELVTSEENQVEGSDQLEPVEGIEESLNINDEEAALRLKIEQNKLDNEFASDAEEIEEEEEVEKPPYILPPMDLLVLGNGEGLGPSDESLQIVAHMINETLESFKVDALVTEINPGPVVTMFEVVPSPGVPVKKIVQRADDLKLRLAAKSIRIIAPIPGKAAVGVEVPNEVALLVTLRDVLEKAKINKEDMSSKLTFALGKDVLGRPINANLSKMPHILIAGATGAGKSVCLNSVIVSLLMFCSPEELKLILIDPKRVELSMYNKLPHLITPIVIEPKRAAKAFQWAVDEMEERYVKCSDMGARNIVMYNQKVKKLLESGEYDKYLKEDRPEIMPYIVIVVDELADLMMTARECEGSIARIAQKARAVGVHMVLATQRPSVNIITGLIKANFPTRISFQTASGIDSKTILDTVGAENLLGNGDMLYLARTSPKPVRLQGTFVSDSEINDVIEFIADLEVAKYYKPKKVEEVFKLEEEFGDDESADLDDELLKEAEEVIITTQRGSIAMLQQKLKVGHKRAQSIMHALEIKGVVGPSEGPKPREVLVSQEAYFGFVE